jgi:hypothetical protein
MTMDNTEWFEGLRTDEAKHERSYWRRVGFAIFLGILIGVLMGPLYGCAQTFQGLCAVKPIGKNENGHTVLATYCEAKE